MQPGSMITTVQEAAGFYETSEHISDFMTSRQRR